MSEEIARLRNDRQSLLIEASLWRDLLAKYGDHTHNCAAKGDVSARCTCGFNRCKAAGFVPTIADRENERE